MAASVLYVTFPDATTANSTIRTLLKERLIACGTTWEAASQYAWEGGIEEATEWLALLKTTPGRSEDVRARVQELHPYEVPCILGGPSVPANTAYADYVAGATTRQG